jgi:hypothetical protein
MKWPPRSFVLPRFSLAQRALSEPVASPKSAKSAARSVALSVVIFFAAVCGPGLSQAFEIIPLYSHQAYYALDGCCQSASARRGGAGILRLELEKLGTWDLYGMSDMKWSEVALLRPQYLVGAPIEYDPSLDGVTKVRRIRRYSVLWSYGVGLFTHNTRTVRFDLATLVTGVSVLSHLELQYSLTDQFSLVAIGRAGAALSLDDRGLVLAPMLGFLWRL